MVNHKIIQALVGYATISAYGALSTLSTTINLLRANSGTNGISTVG